MNNQKSKQRVFVGTYIFASVSQLKKEGKFLLSDHFCDILTCVVPNLFIEMSYKDDLESLGYILIMMLTGNLPWRDIIGRP